MRKLTLNRNQIKYLVIAAMVVDHIAWAWVDDTTLLGQLMHLFGRLTGPTMAYFLAEGYVHTRSVPRYAGRLALFALLSWPAFCLYEFGTLPFRLLPGHLTGTGVWCFQLASGNTLVVYPFFGVIYSLLISLLVLWLWDNKDCPLLLRLLGAAALIWLSRFGDWAYFDPLWALVFFLFRDKPWLKWGLFSFISLFVYIKYAPGAFTGTDGLYQLGVYLVLPLLTVFYNGQSGSRKPVHKWFFYIFYPAHLLLLAALRWL